MSHYLVVPRPNFDLKSAAVKVLSAAYRSNWVRVVIVEDEVTNTIPVPLLYK